MDLNKEYSPSYWSKRYSQADVVDNHIKTVSQVSEDVKRTIPYSSNVKYGTKESWKMDIYGNSLPKDSPVFVYIHGGYWQSLNKDISCYLVKPFYKAGIRVVVPAYTLAPHASMEEIINQIKVMARSVLEDGNANGVRSVWIGGHSAGAHLAASILDEQWFKTLQTPLQKILKGLVLISGIYNLAPIIQTEYNDALNLTQKQAEILSPLNKKLMWIEEFRNDFKVLIAVAENDSPAFQHQTLCYSEHLKKQKINTEFIFLEGLDHFDIVENLQTDHYLLVKTIIKKIQDSNE